MSPPGRAAQEGGWQLVTDGHWPRWVVVPGLGLVIGCECSEHPAKRPARMSTQHTWHQTHRRRLRLQPVEYQWPDDAQEKARAGDPQTSTGGLVQVAGHVWRDGNWYPAGAIERTFRGHAPGGPPAPGHRTLNVILRDAIRAAASGDAGSLPGLRAEYDAAAAALFDTLTAGGR